VVRVMLLSLRDLAARVAALTFSSRLPIDVREAVTRGCAFFLFLEATQVCIYWYNLMRITAKVQLS